MSEKKTSHGLCPAFEVECSTMDEFLRMLELRESEADPVLARSALRRSVFVVELQDYRSTSMGLPSVTRYVVAGFAYGEDLVSMKVYTSRGIEFPRGPESGKPGEKQAEAYEDMREEIEARITSGMLDVPVVNGFLHHASFSDPHAGSPA